MYSILFKYKFYIYLIIFILKLILYYYYITLIKIRDNELCYKNNFMQTNLYVHKKDIQIFYMLTRYLLLEILI